MIGAVAVLSVVAGVLAVIALVPAWRDYPTLAVAVLLLAVALFLVGYGPR